MRRLREYLINVCKYLMAGCKEDIARLFSMAPSDSTRGNWHKMKYRKLPLYTHKKNFFTVNRLPKEQLNSISVLHIQNSAKLGTQQAALADPALRREIGPRDLQTSLSTSTILFYDSTQERPKHCK